MSNEYSYVYFLKRDDGYFKIGKTNDIKERVDSVVRDIGHEIQLLFCIATKDELLEHKMHSKFYHLKMHGECFSPGPDLLDFIYKMKQTKLCNGMLVVDSNYPEIKVSNEDQIFLNDYYRFENKFKSIQVAHVPTGIFNPQNIKGLPRYQQRKIKKFVNQHVQKEWEKMIVEKTEQYKKIGYSDSCIKTLLKNDKVELMKTLYVQMEEKFLKLEESV